MKACISFLLGLAVILMIGLIFCPDSAFSADTTFVDVPEDHPFYDYIETLYQLGYVKGCAENPRKYCVADPLTRAQDAVFIIRGKFGASYMPIQPTEQVFTDVDINTHWGAEWIDKMYREGLTAGCSTEELAYCPERINTIAEGCTFMLKMKFGEEYVPPQAEGIFSDVTPGVWYEPWMEACYEAGILIACETQPNLKACPDNALLRDYAAYMLVKAKDLPLVTPAPTATSTSTPQPTLTPTPTPTHDPTTGALIIDYNNTDISRIPDYWLAEAKKLTFHYANTSHGSQIVYGLEALADQDPKYGITVITAGSSPPSSLNCQPGTLCIFNGNPPETYINPDDYWSAEDGRNRTQAVANTGLFDFSMWSWCGQQSSNSEQTVQLYLDTMNGFEQAYPAMRFILMTGHTDGGGSTLARNNDMVLNYAKNNQKVVFDFASIESYDPAGNYYPNASDACDWCASWCSAHPEDCQDLTDNCPHSHPLQCKLKAQAFWWMMARLAGWDGIQ
jgi:hypothetical protein